MALITIDLCLDHIGTLACTGVIHSGLHGLIDLGGVGAVHNGERHVVSSCTAGQIRGVGHAVDLGGNAVAVVLNEPHHGKLPGSSHVQRLMEGAFVGGAVAEAADGHGIIAHDLGSQSAAGRDALTGADDAVGAQVVALCHISDVHGTALALAVAGLLAEQLSHALLGIHAAGDGMAMAAVGGSEKVLFFNRGKCAGRSGLLANAQMDVTCQHTFGEAFCGMLFKLPDPYHGAVEIQQLFLGVLFSSVLFRCQCFHAFL